MYNEGKVSSTVADKIVAVFTYEAVLSMKYS
jgi:hypothetical protein